MQKQQSKSLLIKSLILNSIFSFLLGILFTLGLITIISDGSVGAGISLILASVILCIIYIYTRIKYSIQPLNKLINNFRELSEGNFDVDFGEKTYTSDSITELDNDLAQLAEKMKELLEQQKDANQVQETILSSLNEGVIATDRRGLVKLETPLVGGLLGKNNKYDDIKSEKYIFLKNINYNHLWSLMARTMDRKESIKEEINITLDNGSRVIEAYITPIAFNNKSGVLAVLRDITLVKQLESLRRDFVANVSHELKTPLTSITGYIELLKNPNRTQNEKQQFYDIISIEADRLQMLISDLLDLSEIEGGDKQRAKNESIYIYEIVDEVFGELSASANKLNLKLHIDVDPDFTVVANRTRIKQIITNLVSNAIKYNVENGDVWVRTKSEGGRLMIIVEDNGIGIAEDEQDKVFVRFFRVNKSRSREISGTGLGLAIVKHIVNLYGGTILLDSEEGIGTKFTVIFPAYRS